MARREIIVDDLDGKEDETVQTRRYSIDGQGYTIDLSDKNYQQFLKDLDRYISVSVKEEAPSRSLRAPGVGRRTRSSGTSDRPYTAADVRAWAQDKGLEVNARGRIHGHILKQYEDEKGLNG